ncbi:hypothetical protein CXB51_000852 [Gossypium anomalum]|uniref:Pentatricopeptide repeat-containing protein n=1 Tax=Gossypium anomalum TaxID=47600 RepID=A0A8J5ZAY3_9ROSI|nr:hypothetical protein CXB51_000852 [Gossypium anomalum]
MGGKADDSSREIFSFRREDGEKGEGLRAESFHGRGGFSCLSYQICELPHGFIGEQLVTKYAKSGYPEDAQSLSGEMPEQDLVSWNSLISGLSRTGFTTRCMMKILNALLREATPFLNLASGNSMIAICAQNGLAEEIMGIFIMMRRAGVVFDQATMLTVLQACENMGVRNIAGSIHGLVSRFGLIANVTIATALLNLNIKWHGLPCALGYGKDAIKFFKVMVRSAQPDHVTFSRLLSACSHSGLVNEGKHYFKIMSEVYGVEQKVDHYSCMVDLLGNSGLLTDGYDVIKCMPREPNSGVWGAHLGACRMYGNTELAKEVLERLFSLDTSYARNYIMRSNIYSAAGMWRDASKVRPSMEEMGLNRTAGCSFIEHGNKTHRFVVGDKSHPEADGIYKKLKELIGKIRKANFMSEAEFVLHDVDEELKENMIKA